MHRHRNLGSRVLRGFAAGAAGTLAMDLLWYSRYRRGGGESPFTEWEVTGALDSWDDAPAPAQMGRKLLRAVSKRDVPVERAARLSNVMHWAYGTAWTAAYATVAPRRPWWAGPGFGATIWASDYVVLPVAGVYQPIWRYDAQALGKDLSAHLVFGVAADATLRLLERG